jgi:hypothetical protein
LQNQTVFVFTVAIITVFISTNLYKKKILFHLLRDNISSDGRSRQLSIRLNYSALLQSTQVLSHCAHFVESQHSFSQDASHGFSALSQPAQSAHSVAAHSPAFSELLLHAHEAAANIAAATANDINTFFIVTKVNCIKQNTT